MSGAGPDPFTGPEGPQLVLGVTHDSRRVQPGDLYAALPGGHHHGAQFCQLAAAAGAACWQNRAPWWCSPGSAAYRSPGRTRRESWVTPRTS